MSKAISSYALASASNQAPMRFLFDGLEIRAVDRADRAWFVGKDVCAILGHANTKDALSRLPTSERSAVKVPDALGRDQNTTIISISGVFRLAMTSRVTGAERFQSWITDEVLPQIYSRGTYGQPDTPAVLPLLEKMASAIESLSSRLDALERRPAPSRNPVLPPPPPPPATSTAIVSQTGLITVGGTSLQLHRVGDGWGCYAIELGRALGYANEGRKFLSYLCPTGHWNGRFLADIHVVRHPRVMLTLEGMRLACILSRSAMAPQLLPAIAAPTAKASASVDSEDDRSGPPTRIKALRSLPFMTSVCTGTTLWVCADVIEGASAGDRQMQAILRGFKTRWGMADTPRLEHRAA